MEISSAEILYEHQTKTKLGRAVSFYETKHYCILLYFVRNEAKTTIIGRNILVIYALKLFRLGLQWAVE